MRIISMASAWRSEDMNEVQKRVWAVATSHQLTALLEYRCDDFEAFCEDLREADEDMIVRKIASLTNA